MTKADKIAIEIDELIDEGIDYLDAGTPLKLTLAIIKNQAVILDTAYCLYIVSKLESYYKTLKTKEN